MKTINLSVKLTIVGMIVIFYIPWQLCYIHFQTVGPTMAPSKSSSGKSSTKRGRDKSQSRSASSKSKSRSRTTTKSRGAVKSKSRSNSVVRSRTRPASEPVRSRSILKSSAAAGKASSHAVSRPDSRQAATTKKRIEQDNPKPVKPKRKMTAYNVFVKEHLTGKADVRPNCVF